MIPTLLGAAVVVFFMLRLLPGDVCAIRLGGTGLFVDPKQLEICRAGIGINEPIYVQFRDFILGLASFEFGNSMWTRRPISFEIGLRFELTLQIAIMAVLTSIIVAIPLGIISAVKRNTAIDYVVRTFSIAGIAMPSFWLGIMIILTMLIVFQSLFGEPWMLPIDYTPIWVDPVANLSQTIWPAIATGYRNAAVSTRMTRSAMLEVLNEDYVRTARAKGLIEKVVRNRHALKNAMLPVITLFGLEFGFLMGGLAVTEQVFNLNGLGYLLIDSVQNQDFTMTQAIVMLVVLVFVVINFIIDILYAWLDPRIRYV